MSTITLTQPLVKALKKRYEKAVAAGEQQFTFDWHGDRHEFLTAYAKYFVEHGENQFKKR